MAGSSRPAGFNRGVGAETALRVQAGDTVAPVDALRFLRRQYGLGQYCLWMLAISVGAVLFCTDQPAASGAIAHAHGLFDLERALHLDPEAQLQRWAASLGLIGFLNAIYVLSQSLSWWAALLALYFVNRGVYRKLRNVLIASWPCSMLIFRLWPCASPRLAHVGAIARLTDAHPSAQIYDQFAALPSLHVCFAVAVAVAVRAALPERQRIARAAVLLWPVLVALAVMGTANHFLLDTLAGAALAGGCYLLFAGGWREALGRAPVKARMPERERRESPRRRV